MGIVYAAIIYAGRNRIDFTSFPMHTKGNIIGFLIII